MSFTSKQIEDTLKKVKHPGMGKDIISLQMVRDIRIEGNKIGFSLVFEKSNDPFISSIRKACVKAIRTYLGPDADASGGIVVKAVQMIEPKAVLPGVGNIIAVASGKGGVGKSTVACNLAVAMGLKGFRTGLIDADIFGPSVPKMMACEGMAPGVVKKEGQDVLIPVESYDIKLLSIGFFVEAGDPVVWRGPMATNALKQFISQADWGELDYLFIDLPPGTSDIHLTMVQELPVTGALIVTTPQNVALADALKGVNMFRSDKINVPVLGLVENMAWFTPEESPDKRYFIFGKDGGRELAKQLEVPLLGQIPLIQGIVDDGDAGRPSVLRKDDPVHQYYMDLAGRLHEEVGKRNKEKSPTKKVRITRISGK